MKRRIARVILAMVAGLWIATVYALSVGAVEPGPTAAAAQCTVIGGQEICVPGGEEEDSPSPSQSPSPSRSPSPTPSPSGSSPRPSGSPSPSGSASPSRSPSPSQTTPPPPSVRTYDSRITISYSDRKDAFKGRVASKNARCERARRVVVKKVKPGKDATVGRTQTNDSGGWTVKERNPRGRYYAKVARKRFSGGNNTTIVCKPAKSRTIRP